MDPAVVTGAFTLGGVTLGGVLEWARSSVAARRGAAGARDEVVTALAALCVRLMIEARTWRALYKPGAKAQQAVFGAMESLARRPPAAGDDVAAVVTHLIASAVTGGLGHLMPASVAERARTGLWPLLNEVAVLAIRLSMMGDEGLKDAADRVAGAAGDLVAGMASRDRDYSKREAEVQAAVGQLRRARDVAAARKRRRERPGTGLEVMPPSS